MTDPTLFQISRSELHISVSWLTGGNAYAFVSTQLQGTSPYTRTYRCNLNELEEASSFADDVRNELRVWPLLLASIVDDLALRHQASR